MADLFFVVANIFQIATQSLHIVLLLMLGSAVAWALGARAWRNGLFVAALVGLTALGIVPLWNSMLQPLEDRFPQPDLAGKTPDGLIVLGGSTDTGPVALTRGTVTLNDRAERMTKALALAKRYPTMRIVFTGFTGDIGFTGLSESDIARRFFEEQGIGDRVTYEDRSRNTFENAVFSKELIKPREGETWLLLTSAAHMPRSVGVFREAGWSLVPYPVDYKTAYGTTVWKFNIAEGSGKANLAAHEWIGLLVYYITGRSDSLFPAPDRQEKPAKPMSERPQSVPTS